MRILARLAFREIATSALLGAVLFSFVFFLQRLGRGDFFAMLLRSSAPPETLAYLLALLVPPTLPFTIPVAVLVGILIGFSRMSADNEITAMRATGIPARSLLAPALAFGFLGLVLAAASSLWLTPWSIRETIRISERLAATQLTAEIQPRVFEESFPNAILYVGDVIPGPVVRWKRVFLADLRPPNERRSGARESGEAPPITIAEEAIAVADPANNRIQLSMKNGSTHELGREPTEDYNSFFPTGEQVLEARKREGVRVAAYSELDTLPLYRRIRDMPAAESVDARLELHQRLALPWACVLFALVGMPLGVSTRRSGKSSAFVLTVALAFVYWIGLITLIGLARQGSIPVALAVWTPTIVFAIAGIVLMALLERPAHFDLFAAVQRRWQSLLKPFRSLPEAPSFFGTRVWQWPQVLDTYVLNTFLFYFLVLLVAFVVMVEIFTFFELLGDIVKNQIAMSKVLTYLLFLAPKLIYDSAPLAVLVAVLVTFGIMAKNNEVTAFKASGVSLYRLSVPVLIAAGFLSGALFAFDHYYVPEANRRQDAIRNEIKGRPVQSFLRPDRKWIFGEGSRVFYYRYFDPTDPVMLGVSVYDLDPKTSHLRRLITAERARWEPSLNTWIFQNGQMRTIEGIRVTGYQDFRGGAATFPEITEEPGYFRKEVKLSQQMNFVELGDYIRQLSQSGLDTVKLQVQQQAKFSTPTFALILAMVSIPFAFLTGNRGAMAGVGASLGIAIAYWSVTKLFEQIGLLNQLPPAVAAWSPVVVFFLSGVYLMARMRT
jgi:LPS export ABC transporter permease LptG/LPS export ABC transporter permease LptF